MKINLARLTTKQLNLIKQFCEEEDLYFDLDCTEISFSSSDSTQLIEFLITNKQFSLARQIEDILFSKDNFKEYDWT